MIHFWMKDRLKEAAPNTRWAAMVIPDVHTSGTVFDEGGGHPARFEIPLEHPAYMVWIESEDLGIAEYLARLVYDTFHHYHRDHPETLVSVEYSDEKGNVLGAETLLLKSISAVGPPNPIGIDNGKMQYSINFETTLERKGRIT